MDGRPLNQNRLGGVLGEIPTRPKRFFLLMRKGLKRDARKCPCWQACREAKSRSELKS
jgi:hypothetical protein